MKQVPSTIAAVCLQHHHETDILGTRMALRITQRTGLVIAIITFMTTMVRTESEIPENKVIVDVRPVFLRGYDGMLQCRFNGAPLAVFWLKGPNLTTATNLVTWYPPPKGVSGSGYVSGKYNLTEDFSLVIHNVQDDDAGRYICRISNFNGFILRNYTEATVKIPPQSPFPTIDQCPTEADGRESCILTQETGADSTELTCLAKGATRGVVSLSWTHGGTTVPLQAPQRSTNPDGVTEDVMVAIAATPSADSYVCVAILSATTRRQATMSVTVNTAPIVTTIEAVTTENVTVFLPEPINNNNTVIVILTLLAFAIILIILTAVLIWRRRKGIYKRLKSDQKYIEGPVSYFELWELVEMCDFVVLDDIVSTLVGNPERELEYDLVRSKAELYSKLCEWKDKSTRDAQTLYAAIEEKGHYVELKLIKDFRARTDKVVSLDDLEHICWHVQSCKETVKPVIRALYSRNEKITLFPGNTQPSGNSRSDVIKNDLQLMKTWKEKSKSTNPEEEGETVNTRQPTSRGRLQTNPDGGDSNERTPMYSAGSEDVDLGAETRPPNQMVRVCLALEEVGRRANESDKLVYHQLAKTFFQIRDEYKSELTDKVLKEFALSITKPHCQRLENPLKLSAVDIATRNEEDLDMFRTDNMLKAWVLDQKCSNYEIRRRLRQAAEQCNRQDIAENFISKEQSEVMTSTMKLPSCLTISNEKQSPGPSASGSKDEFGKGASSQSVPHSSHGDLEETQTSFAQPADNITETEVGFVSAISRDDLDRIGRYAGSAVLLSFCEKYGVTEASEQQSSQEIINLLKPKLDSEHGRIDEKKGTDTPRHILRQLLQDKQPRYACLLAMGKPDDDIFNVEMIDLAFRLIMADVYPFAKALNISDQVLTPYRRNIGPHNLTQDTVKIMKQVYTHNRFDMVSALKQAGYSEEARSLYFGFEISFGDVVEVENLVDKAKLAKQLGVSDDVQTTGPGNQVKDDTLHQYVLLRWRDTVRSSTFNHRLVLADALFSMGEDQKALDIISGVHRNRAIDNQVSDLIAATIPEGELPTLSKVLGQKMKNGKKCQDVINAWVAEKNLINILAKSPKKLSNELLGAGFYAFAHEIMAGAWKEDKKAGQKEGTETGNVELCQGGIAIKKPGEKEGKKEKEDMEKATNGDKLGDNTGKEDEKHGKEYDKALEEETSINKNGTDGEQISLDNEWVLVSSEDLMEAKSGDGAAESREDTTEHVDTKEQDVMQVKSGDRAAESKEMEQGNTPDGSDERRADESSETPLLDTAKLDHWGEPIDNSQPIDPAAISRFMYQALT